MNVVMRGKLKGEDVTDLPGGTGELRRRYLR